MPRRAPPLRLVVMLLVVLPIAAVAAVLVWLSALTSRRVAEDLGRSLVTSATDRTSGEVTRYLRGAARMSDLYARRVRAGRLSVSDLRSWEPGMLDDLTTSPDVASICFGTPDGAATWLLRGAGGRLEVGRVDAGANDRAAEFVMGPDGRVAPEPLRVYHYDPRERPWYPAAMGSMTPLWTPVYFWFGEQGGEAATGAGYTRAVRDESGRLLGVLVIDVTLGALSEYLRRLEIADVGHVFIVDAELRLVAASEGAVTTESGERVSLGDAAGAAGRAARTALGGGSGKGSVVFERFETPEGAVRVMAAPLAAGPGIDWTIVTVLPEKSFMGEAESEQRRGVLLAALSTLGGLALGWRVSRGMTRPLERISEHVRRVGGGDFASRLDLRQAHELETLSADLNKMSEDLAHRAELEQAMAVAAEVQKSLLPASDPHPPGLDIAGRSRYCDAAGGDYFDFIRLREPGRERTLVAVGDVMGHGIGAALLMASARAAIRARVAERPDLAEVLTAVNRVLAEDARHNQFMTMALIALDPGTGEASWASAGHDPAIVYHPGEDRFEELEGGDLPLGTMEETVYEEYRRVCLRAGDVLILGTDGIWEMADPAGKRYGKDRLRELLRRLHREPASVLASALEDELDRFRKTEPQRDDVTFVIARVVEHSGPGAGPAGGTSA